MKDININQQCYRSCVCGKHFAKMKQATNIAELPSQSLPVTLTKYEESWCTVQQTLANEPYLAVFLFNVSTAMMLCPPENFILEKSQAEGTSTLQNISNTDR